MINIHRQVGQVIFLAMLLGVNVHGQQGLNNVPPELVSYPDLIIFNGKIVTMEDASLNNSPGRTVEAMAVQGDRIQFLGSNEEVFRYAGPQTRKIDVRGHTVVPGLINPHTHLHNHIVNRWARNNVDKVEAIAKTFSVTGRTFEELTRGIELVIKEQMAHPLPGQWAWINLPRSSPGTAIGNRYMREGGMTREQLDALAPTLPISTGGALLNTAARNNFLEYYFVDPTDENEELALQATTTIGRSLIPDRYFDTHMDELADVIEDGLKHQAAAGFTAFSSHIVGLRITPAYMKLVRQGRMPIRFAFAHRLCQQVEPDSAGCFLRVGDWAGLGDKYFWSVGLTLGAIDGAPGAGMCTTMEGPQKYKAIEDCILEPGSTYAKAVYAALRTRYRYVVNHVYGDRAVDHVMDIMEQVVEENPDITMDDMRSMRVTADHCGFYPRKEQLPRMKRLGMILSCGGTTLNRSAPWLPVYGEQYANRIAPIKSIIEAGVMPTAETELRVESGEGPTFYAQVISLVTRKNVRGDLIAPEEAIDRVTLLKMSTVWPSYFVLKEKEIGTLEPGKFADFVVFNKDYFTVPVEEIPTVFPLMTVLGGKTIVSREEFATELGVPAVGPQMKFRFQAEYNFGDAIE